MARFRPGEFAARCCAIALLAGAALSAFSGPAFSGPAFAEAAKPQRIVSINYCTDQLLLRLVEPERIASMTFLSWEKDATPAEYAPLLTHIKQNHGLTEEVLREDPDLVLSGTFSSYYTNTLLQRLGRNIHV